MSLRARLWRDGQLASAAGYVGLCLVMTQGGGGQACCHSCVFHIPLGTDFSRNHITMEGGSLMEAPRLMTSPTLMGSARVMDK